ncbi:MAG TPA: thiamine phosphate synthase [Rhizomicrobium sp.]|jgi:thiamine-phosphate pyrophosphorylase|nr:thiamine phosphate synthase [Rhizomicrobium sp.]
MSGSLSRAQLARQAQKLAASPLPALILLTDDERLHDPLASVAALPRGSAVIVRARDRRKRHVLAASLHDIARKRKLFLLIADDPELASEMNADGIHLPEGRVREATHWRATHPDWLITAAAHSAHVVLLAKASGADAVLLSPVFATQSHPHRAPFTPVKLRLIAREIAIPIYALGGIDARNVARLEGAALAGIAAIGALQT